MFALNFFFWGGPTNRFVVCASKPLQVSSGCKNWSGQHPYMGWHIVTRKSRFGWVQTHMSNFLDSGPKFTGLDSPNSGGIVLDQLAFRFSISWIVAEIFAIKVGSCVKSTELFACFWPHFLGAGPPNFWTRIIKRTQIVITWQSFTAIGRRARRPCGEKNE